MSRYLGIVLIILALVTAIVPQFTDCLSQGKAIALANGNTIPMKCHWTGRAEIAVAVPLIAVGIFMATSKRQKQIFNLSVLSTILGISVILLPTVLIGVCPTPTMICHTAMLPTLIASGSIITITSVVGMVAALRVKVNVNETNKTGLAKY